MKPSWITDKVIDNSKLIHELGGRFEVRKGDWGCFNYTRPKYKVYNDIPKLIIKIGALIRFNEEDEPCSKYNFYPIWTARKCEDFLVERGYFVTTKRIPENYISSNLGSVTIWNPDSVLSDNPFTIEAKNKDEACQLAVIKVLEEEKNVHPK